MRRCGDLLSRQDYTERRLLEKLSADGYGQEEIEAVIESLKEAHYLDDYRYALTYVRYHSSDRSRMRIRQDLLTRGCKEDAIEAAFREISEETDLEQEELNQIRKLLRKRGYREDEDFAKQQKMMAFLYRKGFSQEIIRRAMQST